MELSRAFDHLSPRHQGVLVTLRANGRPQISNILYLWERGEPIRISVTEDRAKTRNLRRDPRASLYVVGDDFWSYVVVDGSAEMSDPAGAPDDATVEELVRLYRGVSGEHPDWEEYRTTMVSEHRVVIRLVPERSYGMAG